MRLALVSLLTLALFSGLAATSDKPSPEKRSADKRAPELRVVFESGAPEACVDILFVGDGYVAKDLAPAGKFPRDVQRYTTRLWKDEPFRSLKARFNVRMLLLESPQEGCDESATANKVTTALESHFDTKEGRLLTFGSNAKLKAAVELAGPTDIAFVMVNTERYGGAGTVLPEITVRGRPLPAPTFAAQDTASFLIAVHELGHSFARLADEYVDEPLQPNFPFPKDGDLADANVTRTDWIDTTSFETVKRTAKWKHFLELPGANKQRWAHEGGYYREKGVWRPWKICRMLRHDDPFCPVCTEEVAKSIFAACGEDWDDAAWHKAHPLADWR